MFGQGTYHRKLHGGSSVVPSLDLSHYAFKTTRRNIEDAHHLQLYLTPLITYKLQDTLYYRVCSRSTATPIFFGPRSRTIYRTLTKFRASQKRTKKLKLNLVLKMDVFYYLLPFESCAGRAGEKLVERLS